MRDRHDDEERDAYPAIRDMSFSVVPSSDLDDSTGELGFTEHALVADGKIVRTPAGHPVAHQNRRFLQQVLIELDVCARLDPRILSLYSLFSTQKDFVEEGQDLKWAFGELLSNDPALRLCAGPEVSFQMERMGPLFGFLETEDLKHPHLTQTVALSEDALSMEFVRSFEMSYRRLVPAEKAVLVTASARHGSVSLGLVLTRSGCLTSEYAAAVLAAHCIDAKMFGGTSRTEHRKALHRLIREAEIMKRYLILSQ